MAILTIRNLTVRFATSTGSFTAVDGIDVHVDRGEVLAIVGTLDPHLADLPWISLDSLISGEGSRPLMRIFGELATAEQVSEINNLILKNFSLRRVIESVTMVVPGYSSSSTAEISAIRRLRLSSLPSLATAPARSTSVSNMMPMSALLLSTHCAMESIAALSSGFG